MPQEMLRALQQFMGAKKPFNAFADQGWHPPTDVYESESAIVAIIEIAGLRYDDISIDVIPGGLRVSGSRYDNHREDNISFRRMEIKYGNFEIELPISVRADCSAASATYDDGFLRITVPKRQAEKSSVIWIRITEAE